MRRLVALILGAVAGLVAVRFVRRRRQASQAVSGDASEPAEALAVGEDRASELRRKLDQAREAVGESVGPATLAEGEADDELVVDPSADPAFAEDDTVNGGTAPRTPAEAAQLADKRAHVHGRAREAAESMRDDDPDAA